MAFRVESSIQSSFNKGNKVTTRLGNWQEEAALGEQTGFSRTADFKDKAFSLNAARTIVHSDRVDPKDYKSTARATYGKPGQVHESKPVRNVGPRQQRKLEEMKKIIQEEQAMEDEMELKRRQAGDFNTTTKTSFIAHDPQIARTVNPRVQTMRSGGAMSKTSSQARAEAKAGLPDGDYSKQEAITLYSSKIRETGEGGSVTGLSAVGSVNPFGKSTRFTNPLQEAARRHAEGADNVGMKVDGIGCTSQDVGRVEEVRKTLLKRAGDKGGIRSFSRIFRRMDDSGDLKLDPAEFAFGMADYGVVLAEKDLQACLASFDRDLDGQICLTEFLRFLRGDMNARRRELVNMAYDVLDKNGDGRVTLADIEEAYDVSLHPDVQSGKMSTHQALTTFMNQWETDKRDGYVTRQEFEEYYADLSCSIDDDDYWELMIRNAWHLSGGEGWCANTTCRRVLVVHSDMSQEIVEIKNDIGLRADDTDGMIARLKKQGVQDIDHIELCG